MPKGVIKWILGGVILLHFFFLHVQLFYMPYYVLGIKYNFFIENKKFVNRYKYFFNHVSWKDLWQQEYIKIKKNVYNLHANIILLSN